MFRKIILTFLLLLSGLCGISYEVLYGRVLGGILGDQFAVSAAVLITFLLGIGMGSKYAWRLWPGLWLIEAGIGLYGMGFALARNIIEHFLYNGLAFLPGLAGPILLGTALLLVPAFLIGCSVPLFAGYLSRVKEGPVFSGVYSIYNFGAAATALLIEFLLIRHFGIGGTLIAFGLVNLAVAALLLGVGKPIAAQPPRRDWRPLSLPRSLVVSLILVSVASAIFQLFMVKMSEMMFGPFRETFALVLAIILFGIAFGSYLVKRLGLGYSRLLLANLAGLLFFLMFYKYALFFYADLYSKAIEHDNAIVFLKGGVLFFLMGLPAITFGATIPALLNGQNEVAEESGKLLFIASLANVAGFLLMALLLHQSLSYGVQLLVVSALAAAALIAYKWQSAGSVEDFLPPLAGVVLTFLTVGWQHLKWDEDMLYLSYTSFHNLQDMKQDRQNFNFADIFKGHQDVFSIIWSHGDPFFFINGYISFPMNNPSEKMVGTLGPMMSPKLNDALVLGLGSGSTASAVGLLFDHTDVVEINPVVRENQFRMKRWNFDIEHNPKVNIIEDDGIHYVRSSGKTYDMILNTVTSPLYFSSSKLYTVDFFNNIKKRLRPDGIYLTWMDYRIGTKGAEIILSSLNQRFSHCAVFYIKSGYFLLMASDQPLKLQHPDVTEKAPPLKMEFMRKGIIPRDLAYNVVTSDAFAGKIRFAGPVNTIDYPVLEFAMAGLRQDDFDIFKDRLLQTVTLEDVSNFIEPAMKYDPAEHIAHVQMAVPQSMISSRFDQQGRIYVKNFDKRVDDAIIQSYRRMATELNDAGSYHELGYQFRLRNRFVEALVAFRKAVELDPNHENTQFNIALSLENIEKYSQARDVYLIAGAQKPKNPDVSFGLARVSYEMGNSKEALDYISQSLALEPSGPRYFLKAFLLEELGRKDEAVAAYREALKLNPGGQDVQIRLNKYLAKW
jgi:spermidine synthase